MQHATVCVSKAAPGPGRAGGLLICRPPVAAAFDMSAFSGPPFAQGLRLLRDVAATLALHRLHALPGSLSSPAVNATSTQAALTQALHHEPPPPPPPQPQPQGRAAKSQAAA